tara:strand:+ start:30336 stop:30515 length:180 start_codon:yes stop_codon:yes gene_type:complete
MVDPQNFLRLNHEADSNQKCRDNLALLAGPFIFKNSKENAWFIEAVYHFTAQISAQEFI